MAIVCCFHVMEQILTKQVQVIQILDKTTVTHSNNTNPHTHEHAPLVNKTIPGTVCDCHEKRILRPLWL